VKTMNILLFLWATVPVIAVIVGAWLFLRAGNRWEKRQRNR